MAQHPASLWIDQRWSQLEAYNNEWVAARAGEKEVLAHAPTLDEVIGLISARGDVQFEEVAFVFVNFGIVQ